MRADRDHGRAPASPVGRATAGSTGPTTEPGSRSGGQDARREAEPLGQVGGPRAATRTSYSPVVEALVRSAPDLAGQPVGRAGRGSAAASGRRRAAACRRGDQLVDRVERQLLQAVDGVQLGGADLGRRTFSPHAVGARSRWL